MKRLLPYLTIVIVVAIAAVVIVLIREPSPEAAPVSTGPATQPTGAVRTAASPTPSRVEPEATATSGRPFGNLTVTMRQTQGTDRVACDAIQSEFAVSMASGDGKVRWTGQVFATSPRQYPFGADELRGIALDPATGLLELGQRQLIRVRGTFDGGSGNHFYVVVSAPNSVGTGWSSVEFTCR
jgi:hypothetical protein